MESDAANVTLVSAPRDPAARVVLLLGTNYSGSHLLSHLLSAHPHCFGVGEIHRFQQLLDSGGDAPVVSEYQSDALFDGLAGLPVDGWHETLATRYAERAGILNPVVIDNSKRVTWARRITQGGGLNDVRFVHLIRDPRALVLRSSNTYLSRRSRRRQRLRVARRVPGRAASILTGAQAQVYLYKWLRANQRISAYLARAQRPSVTVTYRDMVLDTEVMLRRLMPLLDLEFDPAQLSFGDAGLLGTVKTAHADSVRRSEIRPDLQWQTALAPAARRLVETNADVLEYLDSLGLQLGDDGLQASSVG